MHISFFNKNHLVNQEVIALCIKNVESGHKALYELSVKYVYAVVSRYVKVNHAHKDIVQEIYANVFSHIDSYDPNKGTFKVWIRKIAVNQSLTFLRKKNNFHSMLPLTDGINKNHSSELDLRSFERENVSKILDKMPVGYKTVFMMSVIDGYSHDDISKQLNISKGTSRSQLNRAKFWLQNRLPKKTKFQAHGSL